MTSRLAALVAAGLVAACGAPTAGVPAEDAGTPLDGGVPPDPEGTVYPSLRETETCWGTPSLSPLQFHTRPA